MINCNCNQPSRHICSVKVHLQKQRKCVPCVSQQRDVSLSLLPRLDRTKPGTTSHWAQPVSLSHTHTHTNQTLKGGDKAAPRTSMQENLSLSMMNAVSSLGQSFSSSSHRSQPSVKFLLSHSSITSQAFIYCVMSAFIYPQKHSWLSLLISHLPSSQKKHETMFLLSVLQQCKHVFQPNIIWLTRKAAKHPHNCKNKEVGCLLFIKDWTGSHN